MALVPDQKFSTFQDGGDLIVGDIVVGLRNGLNTRFEYTGLPVGAIVPISQGGTGATTAAGARTNLGLGTIATQDSDAVAITGGTIADVVVPTPAIDTDIANKAYVDSVATGLNIQPAVVATSTANLTATYDNAASGVGATLTNSSALAALTLDGVALSLNDRVLIPFQTTTTQNGIYTVTVVGDGAAAWVLTRATDFDTPGEIEPGDLVVVIEGTVYENTSFLQTETVTTIGSDPIIFVQFTAAASKVVTLAGTQTITGDKTFTGETTIDGNVTSNNTSIGIDVGLNYPNQTSKNLIIGGNFSINPWQRGIIFTGVASGTYTADRWSLTGGNNAIINITKSTEWPTTAAIYAENSLRYAVAKAEETIAAGQSSRLLYKVEGYDFINIRGRTFTLSFWVRAVKTGTYCVGFVNAGSDRSYVAEYTIDASDTWEFKTITVSASPDSGTWNYTNGVGLEINFTIAAGTNFQTTPDSWQTGFFVATSSQANGMDSTLNNFYLQMVQLEKGEVATPFEQRSRQQELALCQRYYCKTFAIDTAPATNTGIQLGAVTYRVSVAGAKANGATWTFPVSMRAAPTIITYNPNAANQLWRNASTGADSGVRVPVNTNSRQVYIGNAQASGDLLSDFLCIHAQATAEL